MRINALINTNAVEDQKDVLIDGREIGYTPTKYEPGETDGSIFRTVFLFGTLVWSCNIKRPIALIFKQGVENIKMLSTGK